MHATQEPPPKVDATKANLCCLLLLVVYSHIPRSISIVIEPLHTLGFNFIPPSRCLSLDLSHQNIHS